MTIEFFNESSPESVAEQAAAWFVEFESGSVPENERREFVAWLKRSPVHVEEFLQISALQREIGHSPALKASLDEVLADAGDTIVTLDEMRMPPSRPAAKPSRKPRRWAVAASVLVLAAGTLAAVATFYEPGVYRTGIGEQRSIALADGSVITLNTQSEIHVDLAEAERRVTLAAGEALFDVARDASRPFHVNAGATAIRVLGTRFNVYRQQEKTTVTVIEGKVRVEDDERPAPGARRPARDTKGPGPRAQGPAREKNDPSHVSHLTSHVLESGEQIVIAMTGEILQPPKVDLTRATAWTQRRVIFDDAPLSEVAAEFNRYNKRQLALSDPRLAARQVTGVFKVHDLEVLLAFLQRQHDIRIEPDGKNLRITPETG